MLSENNTLEGDGVAQGKRGKALENTIDYTNSIYRSKRLARIDKVPTPWNVQYDRKRGRVRNAFPQKKSTVDFVGISRGHFIGFDAKSTNNKTSFPLKNVEQHQVDFLHDIHIQGGIAFLLVEFAVHQEVYYIHYEEFCEWWVEQFRGGRKSIPLDWFRENCVRVTSSRGVPLDYLKAIGGSQHEAI